MTDEASKPLPLFDGRRPGRVRERAAEQVARSSSPEEARRDWPVCTALLARQPHTHSAGPATSQDAGDEHHESGKRQTNAMRVLRLVYRFQGKPASLLAMRCTLTLTEVRRRLTDLQALNYVKKGKRKGREFTWQITTAGKLALSVEDGRRA